jgi:hypothetical protein
MPVPFPSDTEVLLAPPDAAEVRTIAGGVAGAVAIDGRLNSLQRLLTESIIESMTGFVVPAQHVPQLDPEQFAHAMARRDEAFRHRMLHFMLVNALVMSPVPEPVVDRIDEYARELGVTDDMLRVAHRYSHGNMGLALMDFERSGYMETWDPTHVEPLHTSRALNDAWEQCVADEGLAGQWAALRELPDGTLGREVVKFYDARGFVFPGRQGSAPPLLAQHDWVHVLTDYGSTVESEVEVFAFIARANDDPHAFSFLAMVISLFETGHLAKGAGLFEYDRGHLSHEGMAVRLADAMRRGALVGAHAGGPDLFMRDWFADAARPVEDVREELGVVAKSDYAIERGSVTAWERGGISPFQYDCGQKRAASEGRAYDAYGAEPE